MLAELGRPVETLKARRTRKRRWQITGVVVGVLAVLAAVLVPLCIKWSGINAAPLGIDGQVPARGIGTSDVTTSVANQQTQLTVRLRPHAVQAIAYELTNTTGYSQTILGLDPEFSRTYNDALRMQLTSDDTRLNPNADFSESVPATIDPGHFRTILFSWTVDQLPCLAADGGPILESLRVRVHVGWVTRTETIKLLDVLELEGPSGTC